MNECIEQDKKCSFLKYLRKDKNFIYSIIAIVALLFSFDKTIVGLYDTYIVGAVLSHFNKDSLVVNVFVIIAVFFFCLSELLRFYNKYVPSVRLNIIKAISISVYSYFRFFADFEFNYYYAFSNLAYFDIVFGLLAFSVLLACIPYLLKKLGKKKPNEVSQGKHVDEPAHIDLLGRTDFANSIAASLYDIAENSGKKTSYNLGIIDSWGAGKTSVFNFIKKELKVLDKKKRSIVIIDFEPWIYASDSEIMKGFFDELGKAMSPYCSGINTNLNLYLSAISKIDKTGVFAMFAHLFNNQNLDDLKKSINTKLENTGKNIFVFVDDLDRLTSKEIVLVLKMIKNCASFSNIIFIVAYDKKYIINALENEKIGGGELYLEKIFQVERPLPAMVKEDIWNMLKEGLKRHFEDDHIEVLDKQFNNERLVAMFYFISNIRDVKRICSSLIFRYTKELACEINLLQAFCLEIIYLKNFKLYSSIRRKDIIVFDDKEDIYKMRDDYSENIRRYVLIDDKELYDELLTELFPKHVSSLPQKGIGYKVYFDYYFNKRDNELLNTSEFETFLKSEESDDEMRAIINRWRENNLMDFNRQIQRLNDPTAAKLFKRLKIYLYLCTKGELDKFLKISRNLKRYDITTLKEKERISSYFYEKLDSIAVSKELFRMILDLSSNKNTIVDADKMRLFFISKFRTFLEEMELAPRNKEDIYLDILELGLKEELKSVIDSIYREYIISKSFKEGIKMIWYTSYGTRGKFEFNSTLHELFAEKEFKEELTELRNKNPEDKFLETIESFLNQSPDSSWESGKTVSIDKLPPELVNDIKSLYKEQLKEDD